MISKPDGKESVPYLNSVSLKSVQTFFTDGISFVFSADFTYIFLSWFKNVIAALFWTSCSFYIDVILRPTHKMVALVLSTY